VRLIEGNLLLGDCAGLSCLFSTVVLMYAGAIAAVWILVGLLGEGGGIDMVRAGS